MAEQPNYNLAREEHRQYYLRDLAREAGLSAYACVVDTEAGVYIVHSGSEEVGTVTVAEVRDLPREELLSRFQSWAK